MGIYRLMAGRHRRFENGKLCSYVKGDLIDLDETEVRRLRHRIVPVGKTAAGSLSAQKPDHVFTPGATGSMTVPQLTTVIANTQEPAQLDDIEEQEWKGKHRVSVFRAIARQRKALESVDDEE